MRIKVIITASVIVLLAFIGYFYFNSRATNGKSSNAVTAIFTAINQGDSSGSFAMFSERAREQTSEDSWAKVVAEVKGTYNLSNIEIISDEPLENLGSTYTTEQKPRRITSNIDTATETYITNLVVVLDNDKNWKVDEMTSSRKE